MQSNSRVLLLVEKLDEYIHDIESGLPSTFGEYEENIQTRRFIERTLQIAIETCIDICHHLLKEKNLGMAINDENLIDKLNTTKIISSPLAKKLKVMKKFRNVLVHRYVEIQDEIVYQHATSNVGDFEEFRKEIKAYLKKSTVKTTPPKKSK